MSILDHMKNALAQDTFGIDKKEANNKNICIVCKKAIRCGASETGEGAIYSHAGIKEYRISGMCEHCFDKLFDEES
jgi:hypothetical protein